MISSSWNKMTNHIIPDLFIHWNKIAKHVIAELETQVEEQLLMAETVFKSSNVQLQIYHTSCYILSHWNKRGIDFC